VLLGPPSRHGEGTLYFYASDGTHGFEPWRTNGTTAGTRLVKDIYPGPTSSWPEQFTALSPSRVVFEATDPTHGGELSREGYLSRHVGLVPAIPGNFRRHALLQRLRAERQPGALEGPPLESRKRSAVATQACIHRGTDRGPGQVLPCAIRSTAPPCRRIICLARFRWAPRTSFPVPFRFHSKAEAKLQSLSPC
jgi:ELWxxDGT repeat protein